MNGEWTRTIPASPMIDPRTRTFARKSYVNSLTKKKIIMSATDNLISDFYDTMCGYRWKISDREEWVRKYEEARRDYPEWETRDGRKMRVEDIGDTHLENLIPFIKRRDPENKTHWVDAFECEKRYRKIKSELPKMRKELREMERFESMCL